MVTQLESLQKQADAYKAKLSDSPTAYQAGVVKPRDVSLSSGLSAINQKIENLKSTQAGNMWYGKTPTTAAPEDAGGDESYFMKGLRGLQAPLNMIAGTAEYLTGHGTNADYFKNLDEAMASGLTFGNVMEKRGVPKIVSVPLGFATDIFMDPVNWLTAGTAAFIPRVGMGFGKGIAKTGTLAGGLALAKEGAISGLEKKAAQAMNLVPFVKGMARNADIADVVAQIAAKTAPKVAGEVAPKAVGPVRGAFKEALVSGSRKFAKTADELSNKAVQSAIKYDELYGKTVVDRLGKTGWFGMPAGTIGNFVEDTVRTKIPKFTIGKTTFSGDSIADALKYSTRQSVLVAAQHNKVMNEMSRLGLTRWTGEGEDFKNIADVMRPDATVLRRFPVDAKKVANEAIAEADEYIERVIPVWKGGEVGKMTPLLQNNVKITDTYDNAIALMKIAGKQVDEKLLAKNYSRVAMGRTGVQWYDKLLDRFENTTIDDAMHWRLGNKAITTADDTVKAAAVNDVVKRWNSVSWDNVKTIKPLEKVLNAYRGFIGVFKASKVPMNPSSHLIANLGNTIMGWMIGIPVDDPEFMKSFWKAAMVSRGRLGGEGLREIFMNDINSMVGMIEKNPTLFRKVFGFNGDEVIKSIARADRVYGSRAATEAEVLKVLKERWNIVDATRREVMKQMGDKALLEANPDAWRLTSPTQTLTKSMGKTGEGIAADVSSSYLVSEIQTPDSIEALKVSLAQAAKDRPYNPAVRLLNTMVNSMPKWYEQTDQTWKIATTDFISRIGLTEEQLVKISRSVPSIGKKDITNLANPIVKNGQRYYTLTPQKAGEVALEAFMDYSAMPDIIRVLRALPIVGSPFFSFPYAMAIKTGKTAINNPAIFNKVGFAMNEWTGLRSPEEKAAMEEKYNTYLNSPSIVRLFGMWNTDVKNWVPYYTMNMFNQSQRKYGDSTQAQLLRLFDKFPILQDPVGSVIKDFFIQPALLFGTGEIPQGQFGQAILPYYDAKGRRIEPSLGTRAFYAGRTITESAVPGVMGFAGLLGGGASQEVINMFPSYLARKLAEAAQGKTPVGKQTKEAPSLKVIRALSGGLGVPLYPLDTTKTSFKP